MWNLTRPRTGSALWAVIAIALLAQWLTIWVGAGYLNTAWMRHLLADLYSWRLFWERTTSNLIPYVDFPREYPVGAGAFFWLLSAFLPSLDIKSVAQLNALAMGLFSVLNAGLFYLLARLHEPRRALAASLLFVVLPTALVLSPARFEAVSLFTILLGLWFHRQGQPHRAAFCWSLGFVVKWYPLVFLLAQEFEAFWFEKRRRQWLRSAVIFCSVTLGANLPFLLLGWLLNGSIEHWWATYTFHAERWLAWDTIPGVIGLWGVQVPWERSLPLYSLVLNGLLLILPLRLGTEYRGALLCMAPLILNRVYSPQFHMWFCAPLLLGLLHEPGPRFRRAVAALLLLEVVNVLIFPFLFEPVLQEVGDRSSAISLAEGKHWTELFTAAVLLRGLLLAALSMSVLRWSFLRTRSVRETNAGAADEGARNHEAATAPNR